MDKLGAYTTAAPATKGLKALATRNGDPKLLFELRMAGDADCQPFQVFQVGNCTMPPFSETAI
jgi:hypothetical protein